MRRSGTIISTSTSAVGILVGTRRRTSASTTNTIAASSSLCILEPTWSGLTSTFYCSFCSLVVPVVCLLYCQPSICSQRQHMRSFCIHSDIFFCVYSIQCLLCSFLQNYCLIYVGWQNNIVFG